ncbi:hypothetical protein GGI20_001002 [Coemansia sp. BCRC 34301]|nr:hypothetical protein GGI20_001002 [Coemansia sp. BCRC 34301]
MEVEIHPITLETTRMLARLFPSAVHSSSTSSKGGQLPRLPAYDGQPQAQVLDMFFAADFIPPNQHGSSSRGDHESYGVKYVRYLHQFSQDQLLRLGAADERVFVDKIVEDLGPAGRSVWDSTAREAVLAYAIAVQAHIERSPELLEPWGTALAEAFWASRLPGSLWRSIHSHLGQATGGVPATSSPSAVRADELEVAVELLFLFSNWSAHGAGGSVCGALGMRAVQRVCLAVELFTRYARHTQRPRKTPGEPGEPPGRVQRLRVGHKALLLLEVTWRLVVGGEAQALRRIGGDGGTGLARDALRQISEAVAKYPLLAPDVRADAERLQPFVHPFDGHLTRVAQLGRFGPMRAQEEVMGPTQVMLADMLAKMNTAAQSPPRRPRELGLTQPPPRAARDAIGAYVACVRMTRSEREYAEWWRRLVRDRGLPLSLTLNSANAGAKRGLSSDVTINYGRPDAHRRFEFCGIVEAEDLPGLEMHLDGRDVAWPASTAPEPEPLRAGYAEFYRALFPLLPALCRALVLTVVNWSPADRELPQRPFLASVGSPVVSASTCLGIVKYPARDESPANPLGGSNVKRLQPSSTTSLHSAGSESSDNVAAGAQQRQPRHASPEVSGRLVTQYAQWQAVGGLLMRLMLGLQANHVLQADYMAQLLMNENLIPALFWWLGTANLDLCVDLPPSIRTHTFMATYATPSSEKRAGEWMPAIRGLYDCMRVLRRLTSHNGLRKGLLYKNKALYFYSRLLKLPHASIRQIAAELYRDIMPVVSKKLKMQPACLESIALVYVNAPPSLADAFWLADFSLDPQVEMHRHVELLRLLHFYHNEAFGLRLPRDPALFPSLVSQVVDMPQVNNRYSTNTTVLPKPTTTVSKKCVTPSSSSSQKSCRHNSGGAEPTEHPWLVWESDLEDALNDVYSPQSAATAL